MFGHYLVFSFIFFFNDTATTEIYTLSLHDALPIYRRAASSADPPFGARRGEEHRDPPPGRRGAAGPRGARARDRKSTRLNSSHANISYAVFCLKKKKETIYTSQSRSIYESSQLLIM